MKKCSEECMPCCDFCIHCVHDYAKPLVCALHRDYEHQKIVEGCGECEDFHCFRVPPTNADRIRAMSDEELAEWLVDATVCERVCPDEEYCHGNGCIERVGDWLQQPAKEDKI